MNTIKRLNLRIAITIILLLLIIFSVIGVLGNYNFDSSKTKSQIELLSAEKSSSLATVQMGTIKYLNNYGDHYYSDLTADTSGFSYNSTYDGLVWFVTPEETNGKSVYFDFNAKMDIPKYTEYKVKYTATFETVKYNTSGSSNTGITIRGYDFGSDLLGSGLPTNAENLYSDGTNLQFANYTNTTSELNSYWVGKVLTTSRVNTPLSFTYEVEEVFTNNTKDPVTRYHNFGYYLTTQAASAARFWAEGGAKLDVSIEVKNLSYENPQDLESPYTGVDVTLADITDPTKLTWYVPSVMTLTYPSPMKESGEYKVKVRITGDSSGKTFTGSPNTGKGESADNLDRIFTFKITKKKIGVNVTTTGGMSATAKTGDVYGDDTSANGRAPTFGFVYTSTDGKGYNSETYPTTIGDYKWKVKITNDCNYELDKDYEDTFSINAKEVAKPSIVGLMKRPYNGGDQDFTLSGVSADVVITPPSGSGMIYASGKLTARNAKKYKVTVALADNGVSTQWAASDGGGIAAFDIDLEIEQAPLKLSFEPSGVWSWDNSTSKTVSITDDRQTDSDSIKYVVKYGATVISASDVTQDATDKKKTNIIIPVIATGSYALSVELDMSGGGDEGNYRLSGTTSKTFNVTDRDITITDNDVIWRYQNADIDSGKLQTIGPRMPGSVDYEVTYNAKEYTFSVDETALGSLGLTVKSYTSEKSTVVGNMTTNVTLEPTSSTGTTVNGRPSVTYSIKWKINQGVYDLSAAYWDYISAYTYTGIPQKVELKGIEKYTQLSISYTGTYQTTNAGKYKAEIIKFNNSDSNFKNPDKSDPKSFEYNGDTSTFPWELNWEIGKAKITVTWESKNMKDSNGKEFTYYTAGGVDANKLDNSLYYKQADYDNTTDIASGSPIQLSDIVIINKRVDSYWAVAQIKSSFADNYEIDNSSKSRFFSVGSLKEEVRVDLNGGTYLFVYDGNAHGTELAITASALTMSSIDVKYYELGIGDIKTELTGGAPSRVGRYVVEMTLNSFTDYFELTTPTINFEITAKEIEIVFNGGNNKFTYDGNAHGGEYVVKDNVLSVDKITATYYKNSVATENVLDAIPTNAGSYTAVFSLSGDDAVNYTIKQSQIEYEIEKIKITAKWNTSGETPVITNLDDSLKAVVGYIYYDADGNELEEGAKLEKGKTYRVKAIITGENGANYEFVAEDGFTVLDEPTMTDEQEFTLNNGGSGGISIDSLQDLLDGIPLWQLICIAVGVILLIIFISKTISNENKRKKAKNLTENKYKTYYAASAAFLGLSANSWTAIACSVLALVAISFVAMILSGVRKNKAQDQLDIAKDEYEERKAQKKEDDMRMMFMGIMGGNGGQGMPQFVQQGMSADEMRGLLNEAVTALLPNMQQMLPEQASANDEMMQRLLEKEEKNDETIKKLMEQNERLMQQLAEKPAEKMVEKEIAAANGNDELLRQLVEKSNKNDETISKLMEKLVEMSANQRQQVVAAQPQIIERVVEKPVEKIVEKEIRVEVPVEKVVEKPVIHVIDARDHNDSLAMPSHSLLTPDKSNVTSTAAERSQQVKPAPKKEAAPRLTLEEAYAKLTKEQKKYFDGLREYAMKKDSKCKEKLATYFTTIGPSTTNPLIKLTIKKGVTVALFKMEDEYLKDIRRNASSDGTKLKVKETELPVGDSQAFDTAKDMIDLRIDQIERYEDFMKEQRAMKRK